MSSERSRRLNKSRVALWSGGLLISALLGGAGLVWRPAPDVEVVFAGAEFQARLGLFDQAREGLEEVLRRRPDHGYAHLLLGFVDAAQGNETDALLHLERGRPLLEAAGDCGALADYFLTTGRLKLSLGDFSGAWEDAGRALDTAPGREAAAHLIRAFSRLGAGDDKGYRRELARAFGADPFDPLFRMRRSLLAKAIPWAAAITIGAGRGPRPLN